MRLKGGNPNDDLPAIKKRIKTELFIDRKQGLYIQKVNKGIDQETF